MRLRLFALAALFPLAACSTVVEAVKGPELAPVGYPSALVPREQALLPLASAREPLPQRASAEASGTRTAQPNPSPPGCSMMSTPTKPTTSAPQRRGPTFSPSTCLNF